MRAHSKPLDSRPIEPKTDSLDKPACHILERSAAASTVWCAFSQMADDLPQITELDLSPVIARRDGALAADARILLQPTKSTDAYLRQLR